jgi:thymidylate synthase (FAD)
MKIIEPRAEIVHPGPEDGIGQLQFIETMARISHRSEDKQTSDSWKTFIPAVVMQHGDWSVVEHESATVLFRVDRGVTHELVRHRLFSFTQESTRFVRYGARHQFEFIQPDGIETDFQSLELFKVHCNNSESIYNTLLARGGRPQEARAVLPNALAATIAVTGNLRNWRHFLLMRTSKETHPDFKRVTIPLLAEFKKRIPILYDDIEPEQRQIENLRKPR